MSRSFNTGLFSLTLLIMTSVGWAAAYDLDACFQSALKQSEVLADQTEQILQAEEHYSQALGTVYPNVFGYASYLRQQDTGTASNQPEQHQVKLGLTQPLFRGLREFAAIRQAGDLIQSQKEAKAWAAIQLYTDVAQTFYSVLAFQKEVQHLDVQLELYQKRILDLKGRVAIGRSRPSEVLTVQTALANLKAQRLQLAVQGQAARETLGFLTGLNSAIEVADYSSWPVAAEPVEACLQRIPTRPDVVAARKHLDAARANLEATRGAHWPSLDLAGNYYLDRSGSLSNVAWDAQLALTLPIFTGFITRSKITEAESQYRQNELTLQRLQRLAEQDVRLTHQSLLSTLAQVTVMQEAAALSEKNYQAVLHDYNYGLVTNLDVLQAMSTYQDNVRALDRLKFSVLSTVRSLDAVSAKYQPLREGK